MKHVLLINEGSSDNLGDQAIKYTIENLLEEKKCLVDFADFTRHKAFSYDYQNEKVAAKNNNKQKHVLFKKCFNRFKNTLRLKRIKLFFVRVKWLMNNFSRCKKQIRNKKYDLFVIGGGQLILSNNYFSIAMLTWVSLIKYYTDANVVLFAVGCGTKFSPFEKLLYSTAFNKIDTMILRDSASAGYLKENFNLSARIVPDPVFAISKIHSVRNKKKNKVLVGIADYNVYKRYNNNQKNGEQYCEFWVEEILKFYKAGFSIELFYTTLIDKRQTIILRDQVYKNYGIDLNVLNLENLQDLIIEISQSYAVFSARMHALIIAISYGVKPIPYEISNKLSGFKNEYINEKVEIEELIDKINKGIDFILKIN